MDVDSNALAETTKWLISSHTISLERAETAPSVPCVCGCGRLVCVRARAVQPRRSALQRLKANDLTLSHP